MREIEASAGNRCVTGAPQPREPVRRMRDREVERFQVAPDDRQSLRDPVLKRERNADCVSVVHSQPGE
ncbi:MAG: hypothetical protein JO047_04795 [Alphaproteobacteria bacterium]|nr:hypothetical protein [Alphaproteobacteria bacterium]